MIGGLCCEWSPLRRAERVRAVVQEGPEAVGAPRRVGRVSLSAVTEEEGPEAPRVHVLGDHEQKPPVELEPSRKEPRESVCVLRVSISLALGEKGNSRARARARARADAASSKNVRERNCETASRNCTKMGEV